MKAMVAFFLLVSSACFSLDHAIYASNLVQIHPMWFSEDFKTLYIQVVLVPEEDSPFHYGMWGQERGTHVYEIDFFEPLRDFKHSSICKCKDYYTMIVNSI